MSVKKQIEEEIEYIYGPEYKELLRTRVKKRMTSNKHIWEKKRS